MGKKERPAMTKKEPQWLKERLAMTKKEPQWPKERLAMTKKERQQWLSKRGRNG